MNFITTLPLHTLFFLGLILLLTAYFHVKYGEKTLTYGPTILTTTGIFATFLGIALGLSDFNVDNIQASVPALIGGLKTAFWASVAGVGGALTIKFRHYFIGIEQEGTGSGVDGEVTASDLAKLLQGIQQALVGNDDSTLVSQIKLSRQDSNDRLDALKKAQQEALLKLSEMGSKALVEALRDVIKDFNKKLTEQFGENFKQLNEAVGKLVVWQDQYKTHIETLTARQVEMVGSMKVASHHYSELVNRADIFTQIASNLSTLLASLETQKQQLVVMLTSLTSLLNAASGSLPQVEKKVMELTDQLAKSVEANQKEVSKALAENVQLIRTSIQGVGQDYVQINKEFNKHVGDMTGQLAKSVEANQKEVGKALAENVQLIRTSIQGVGQDYVQINKEFNKHVGDMTDNTKKQVSALDAALAEELKKSLEGMGRQLAALSEKFASDYTPLAEKLKEVVNLSRNL